MFNTPSHRLRTDEAMSKRKRRGRRSESTEIQTTRSSPAARSPAPTLSNEGEQEEQGKKDIQEEKEKGKEQSEEPGVTEAAAMSASAVPDANEGEQQKQESEEMKQQTESPQGN